MNKDPTICLNMIVKNESNIIYRLFDSVVKWIDCYCICDTGSTDDTVNKITQYFKDKNIPGKIVVEPFKDFSHNRNFSLQACKGMSDYVLLLDADMVFHPNENVFSKKMLTLDAYYILQGSNDFYYKNVRIVRNDGRYSYVGVTHEYMDFPQNTVGNTFEKNVVFINDVGDGGSKGNKYVRDVELLTRGITENPKNDRYHFYLANTLKDMGKHDEAIEMYKRRIALGGWNQEIWQSYYKIGTCYKNIGKMPEALDAWLMAYNILPNRAENLYEIVKYYRETSKHNLSYLFYTIAKNVINECGSKKDEYLFLENDVYTHKCDYEYTIIAYYIENKSITNIRQCIMNVMNNCFNGHLISNLLKNIKFYDLKLVPAAKCDMSFTLDHEIDGKSVCFYSSSSSILPKRNCNGDTGGYIMNVRMVNYKITSKGYETGQYIVSLNKYVELTDDFHIIKEKEKLIDMEYVYRCGAFPANVIGVEDLRLFYDSHTSPDLSFIGVGFHENDGVIGVVHGKYNSNGDTLRHFEIKPEFNLNSPCEKNWVFANIAGEKRVIYGWNPLQICKIDEENSTILRNISSRTEYPGFFHHIRGSTCGFNYRDQIWFVVHIVSHEQPRHYYHMMLVFENNEDMKLIKYTPIFKFDEHCIEYCIGLIVEDSRIITTYSTWDRTTNIAIYDKKYIEEMMIKLS
jgi:tetratricopeptide (TPR) repeat protein